MEMNGARIVIECLLEQNVDVVFGYPGGTILNVYDALYDYEDRIKHILTAHEQGAAHAADGYARATGKTGVCFATSGPGSTNLVTGIATAYMDSVPVIFITCNVAYPLLGKDAFQEMDITGVTMPMTKCNYLVTDVTKLADIMREAFTVAESGRKGPILIDLMKDVTAAVTDFEPLEKAEHKNSGRLKKLFDRKSNVVVIPETEDDKVEQLAELVRSAKRPMIIAGGGIISSDASEELKRLAEKYNIPVACTMMGLGSFPSAHPLFPGMIGMHGSRLSNTTCAKSDLIISVGSRLNDRVALNPARFNEGKTLVQIDIDSSEQNKNLKAGLNLIGDAKNILTCLNNLLDEDDGRQDRWFYALNQPTHLTSASNHQDFLPIEIIRSIYAIAGDNVIMVTDVGQHQVWTTQNFPFSRPRQLITSGGFGTMGFGLGAAMGAKLGNPDIPVVEITGDGCFRMNCNELATVEHYQIPVITIIFNNGTLGMVRQWQSLLYDNRYSQTTLDRGPDFVKLAEAYGISGYSARTVSEFEASFREALNSGRAAVIDCRLGIDEKVSPMVQSGKHLTEFLLN